MCGSEISLEELDLTPTIREGSAARYDILGEAHHGVNLLAGAETRNALTDGRSHSGNVCPWDLRENRVGLPLRR